MNMDFSYLEIIEMVEHSVIVYKSRIVEVIPKSLKRQQTARFQVSPSKSLILFSSFKM